MEADKRVYFGSTYADFINWVNERLMHLKLEANDTDIVAEWRLIKIYTVAVPTLIFINWVYEKLMRANESE
jgi:hypothetical protein